MPRTHHKHMKSSNMLERLNEEIKRRTRVVRIFPNIASCLRLIRALCVETHETWLEDNRYLNMMHLAEQKNELLRLAALSAPLRATPCASPTTQRKINQIPDHHSAQLDAHNYVARKFAASGSSPGYRRRWG